MTGLRAALADYLALRRALGYKLAVHERLLGQFLDFLEANPDDSCGRRAGLGSRLNR